MREERVLTWPWFLLIGGVAFFVFCILGYLGIQEGCVNCSQYLPPYMNATWMFMGTVLTLITGGIVAIFCFNIRSISQIYAIYVMLVLASFASAAFMKFWTGAAQIPILPGQYGYFATTIRVVVVTLIPSLVFTFLAREYYKNTLTRRHRCRS